MTNASEGSPKGVFTRASRVSLKPAIEYRPLPPMMPSFTTSFTALFFVIFRFFAICSPFQLFWNLTLDSIDLNRFRFVIAIALAQICSANQGVVRKEREPTVLCN